MQISKIVTIVTFSFIASFAATACGGPESGGTDVTNGANGTTCTEPNGRALPDGSFCFCGTKRSLQEFEKLRALGATCDGTPSDAGNCVIGGKCVDGTNCTGPSGVLVCKPCGYMPEGTACPSTTTDAGMDCNDTGTPAPPDTGVTDTATPPPADTGTPAPPADSGTPAAGYDEYEVTAETKYGEWARSITISQWEDWTSDTTSVACASETVKYGGPVYTHTCKFWVTKGHPAAFNAEINFDSPITVAGKNVFTIWSCYQDTVASAFNRYGTITVKRGGVIVAIRNIDNGPKKADAGRGCNVHVTDTACPDRLSGPGCTFP